MSTPYSFKENKYSRWYNTLISNILTQHRTKVNGVCYENHHIIPKSLGGSNRKINMVLLTPKEHFICHMYLIRMVQDKDVYRMVNTIRRFVVKNSNKYNFIRNTISNHSKGMLNPSYGKIWIHNIETLEVLYIQKNELEKFDINTFKKGLPFQRGGHKNSININKNGISTIIPKEELEVYLKDGWVVGRLYEAPLEQLKEAAKKRHTKEKDKEHSEKIKGRVAIIHEITKKVLIIHPEKLEEFLELGFVLKAKKPLSGTNF